jgi:hypothetical protein
MLDFVTLMSYQDYISCRLPAGLALYIRSLQFPLALQRQKVEALVFYDLANHIHLDVAGICLVIE